MWVLPDAVFLGGYTSIFHRIDRGTVTCSGAEAFCSDYWDNDCDGVTDACDSDCAGKALAEQCANDLDDDCDGAIDCADTDGAIDCADTDCATAELCVAGGACQAATAIACNATANGSSSAGAASRGTYPCASRFESAREVVYTVSRPTAGDIVVTMTNLTTDLDLIAVGAAPTTVCDANGACIGASTTTSTAPEVVTIPAAAGTTYYVVVDGPRLPGGFTLTTSCP